MDTERAFLSKVVLSGQIEQALAEGINDSHFEGEQLQDIFAFVTDHARKYKSAPSLEVVREKFPDFNFEVPTDSFEYLKHRFVGQVKKRTAMRSIQDLAEVVVKAGDSDNIEGMFMEEARRLSQLMPTTKISRFSEIDKRIDAYESGEDMNYGIKMGIPEFDKLTMGVQPHEFVSVVGWQGTGKSTLVQWIMFNAWMQGRTPLMISLEMEWKQLMRKWDTMMMHFSYSDLKAGKLPVEDLERWRSKAEQVREGKCDILVKDDVRSCTPDFIYGEVMRYQPDIVAVDYVSLMDTSRSAGSQHWEKVTYLTQSLKQIARVTGVPIIGVAQTNISSAQGGAQLDNIAYSRSVGQDSDIVLGLHQDDDMKEEKKMTVRMLKNRDGATAVADLLWDMDRMEFNSWNEIEFWKNREKRERVNTATGEIISE